MVDSSWHVRVATPDDAAALLAIYAPFVSDTTVSFETEVPTVDEFRTRIERTLARYPYLVAETEDGRLLGYCYAGTYKARAGYDHTVECTVYTVPEARGAGVSHALYDALDGYLERMGVYNVEACITYPNPASEKFHAKRGFATVAHFHHCGYKLGEWLDMIWMEKELGVRPAHPAPLVPFPDLLAAEGERG